MTTKTNSIAANAASLSRLTAKLEQLNDLLDPKRNDLELIGAFDPSCTEPTPAIETDEQLDAYVAELQLLNQYSLAPDHGQWPTTSWEDFKKLLYVEVK